MARKIATPAAVFAACAHLEATGEAWNRDDVRAQVGGGGFNVIDPLIRAWVKLKPVKALAPSTPTELLFLLAQALDAHLTDFMGDVERREQERSAIFEATTLALSEKMTELEQSLTRLEQVNFALDDDCKTLQEKLNKQAFQSQEKEQQFLKLQAINDSLTGQTSRLQQEKLSLIEQHESTIKKLVTQHQKEFSEIKIEHKNELEKQKRESQKNYELSENHLMKLFDRERTDLKKELEKADKTVTELRNKEQSVREQFIEAATREFQLNEKIVQLETTIINQTKSLAELQHRCDKLANELTTLHGMRSAEGLFAQLQASLLAIQAKIEKA